jgi:hypothetical protein
MATTACSLLSVWLLLLPLLATANPSSLNFARFVDGATYRRTHDAAAFILTHRPTDTVCFYLDLFHRNFVAHNPADVFVFAVGGDDQHAGVAACVRGFPSWYTVNLLAHADALGWTTPQHAADPALWSAYPKFNQDYRRMGHWRLAHQFKLAADMGYATLLQVDDDSYFGTAVVQPVLAEFRQQRLKMATRVVNHDDVDTTIGLPELTRYFVTTENVTPTLLYSHCDPPSIDGLFTAGHGAGRGWDRAMLFGNFVVYDVDWMVSDVMVQRYIHTVLRTGGHFRFRWNEQATLAMVWQLFVGENEWALYDFEYSHHGKR